MFPEVGLGLGLGGWEQCTEKIYRLRDFAARNAKNDFQDLNLAFTASESGKLHEGCWKHSHSRYTRWKWILQIVPFLFLSFSNDTQCQCWVFLVVIRLLITATTLSHLFSAEATIFGGTMMPCPSCETEAQNIPSISPGPRRIIRREKQFLAVSGYRT